MFSHLLFLYFHGTKNPSAFQLLKGICAHQIVFCDESPAGQINFSLFFGAYYQSTRGSVDTCLSFTPALPLVSGISERLAKAVRAKTAAVVSLDCPTTSVSAPRATLDDTATKVSHRFNRVIGCGLLEARTELLDTEQ